VSDHVHTLLNLLDVCLEVLSSNFCPRVEAVREFTHVYRSEVNFCLALLPHNRLAQFLLKRLPMDSALFKVVLLGDVAYVSTNFRLQL
jgi:hypothetical protein